jgi:hypothetical protein
MTHRFSSLLFENESRALGDVNISDFHFFFQIQDVPAHTRDFVNYVATRLSDSLD